MNNEIIITHDGQTAIVIYDNDDVCDMYDDFDNDMFMSLYVTDIDD